jgi:lysophospholipase L1-like esterase
MTQRNPSRILSRIFRLGAGILAMSLVGLVAAELVLRAVGYSAPIWYQPDALLGWSMRPGVQGWYTHEGRAYIEVSPAGFRDRMHAVDKPAGVYRIAVLGDSVGEALQIDMKATFWWLLQEKLRACPALGGREVEALNFSASGYGTAQEALLLESNAIRYQPDLVLLAFAGNDVRDNSTKLTPEKDRPFFVLDGDRLKLDTSFTEAAQYRKYSSRPAAAYRSASDYLRLVQLVQKARQGLGLLRQAGNAQAAAPGNARPTIEGLEPGVDLSVFAPPRDAVWEEAWTLTDRIIARMNAFAAAHNARFAAMVVTNSTQLYLDPRVRKQTHDALAVEDLFYMERRLDALAKREGFLLIPIGPELQKRADAQKINFHGFKNLHVGWGHWNEDGHRAASEIVAAQVCAELQAAPKLPNLAAVR